MVADKLCVAGCWHTTLRPHKTGATANDRVFATPIGVETVSPTPTLALTVGAIINLCSCLFKHFQITHATPPLCLVSIDN